MHTVSRPTVSGVRGIGLVPATLTLLAGSLGGVIPAFAQTPLPLYDETVVVTASAIEDDPDDVPASVTVIEAEEIEARQATSVLELLGTGPGVTAVTAGPPGQQTSVFLRGTESDQVLLLWNGIELNNPYFGNIGWPFLPTEGVERVEVVRGPASALYGGNAVGGVVQVLSGSLDGVALNLEGGEDAYLRGGVTAGRRFGALRVDVAGHIRRGDSEFDNGFFDSEEALTRLAWEIRPGMSLGLVARVNNVETGIPFSDGAPSPERTIAWEERTVALPWKARWGAWSLDAQLSQVELVSAFRDPADAFGFTRSDVDSEARKARAVASYRVPSDGGGDRFWVALGSEWNRWEVTETSSFGPSLVGDTQETWALFGQGSATFGRLTFDLGLRRDDSDVYGAETSLRTGAVLRLGSGVRLRASYGEAFRPPTLGELFFPFTGNPELRPETSEAWEVGLAGEWQAGGHGSFEAEVVAFETRQRDLIDFDFATFRNVNVGRARSRGVEVVAGFAGALFAVKASATFLDAEDLTTGEALLRRPEKSAGLVITVKPGAWLLNLEGSWVGKRPDVDPATFARAENPSHFRLDLAAKWRLSARLAPFGRIENLTGEDYAEALGFPAPGRTVVAGLAVGF